MRRTRDELNVPSEALWEEMELPPVVPTPEDQERYDREAAEDLRRRQERDAAVAAERRQWNDKTPTPPLGTETMWDVVSGRLR